MVLKRPEVNVAISAPETIIRPGDVGVKMGAQNLGHNPMDTLRANEDAWRDYIAGWHVPKPVQILLSIAVNGPVVYLQMRAKEVDARDRNLEVDLRVDIPVPTALPDENSDRWVRALCRWLVCHELDEFIHIGVNRPFDPHRGGRMPSPGNS